MPKKKSPPPRSPHRPGKQTLAEGARADSVDWNALVASMREDSDDHGIARRLLEIGKTMTTGAAHMYLLGEYLLERKKETRHGDFGTWVRTEGLAPRTARKYMAFARRMAKWTSENGTHVPLCTLATLLQGDPRPDETPPVNAGRSASETSEAIPPEVEAADSEREDSAKLSEEEVARHRDRSHFGTIEAHGEAGEGDAEPALETDEPLVGQSTTTESPGAVEVIERFAAASEAFAHLPVEGMSRAEIRRLAKVLKGADEMLKAVGRRAVRRMKSINDVELEEAS